MPSYGKYFYGGITMQYLSNQNTKDIDFCINNFIQALETLHFANITIQRYSSHLNRFKIFCSNYDDFLSVEIISQYLSSMKNSSSKTIQFARKVLGRFKDFTLTKSFKTKYLEDKKILVSTDFLNILDSFKAFLSNLQISSYTQKQQHLTVKKFLTFLEYSHIYSFNNFDLSFISKYINNSNYSHSSKCLIASILKKFFNFTFIQNITSFSGNDVFFKIKRNPHDRILSFYSTDEISKLISVINTSSDTGKRNYAIILLAATLGFRASDIVNLKFEDIDWDNKLIRITQQKNKKELIQPFTDEIYFALLDYLKNARHETNSSNVFVSLRPPYQALSTSALYLFTSNYFKLSNIDISHKKHGIHALRHSLANNMLHDNISLQDISVSLGHTFISTTTMYTNIDINTLKLLSLEVI